jgi:hypothetical protein
MSKENVRRLVLAACLAIIGLGIGDMLRSLRRHS